MKSSEPGFSVPPQVREAPEDAAALNRVVAAERAFAADLDTRRPWATQAIIAACVITFLLQMALPGLARAGVNQGHAVAAGDWWRLFSAVYLHGGLLHIGMNMWSLWVLGPFVERVLGSPRFVVLYALTGLAGSLASAALHPMQSSLGASGAIWGLMGAAMGLALRPHGMLPPFTARNIKRRLIQPLVLNVAITFGVPNIDAYAHFGGGAAGFLLLFSGALTWGAAPEYLGGVESAASKTAWRALAALLSLAMLASVGAAVWAALAR